jgi:phytoene dehydrogenase-like protein
MTDPNERFDLAVVGGGLAGLTAAAAAARLGRSVVVLERADAPGGRAATHVRDGASLNLGAHALYRGGHAFRILRDLGVPFTGRVPDPGRSRLYVGDAGYAAPTGAVSLLASRLLTLGEKWRLARFLGSLARLDTAALDRVPLADWLRTVAGGPGHLAALLRTLVRVSTYADDAGRLSAGAALAQLRLALAGNVWYLDGGWQTLVDGLRNRAAGHGASVRTGSEVAAVEPHPEGVAVRLPNGGTVLARAAVLAVPPGTAVRLLGLPADDPLARWERAAVPLKAACLDVVLDRLPRPADRFALGLDRPLYFSVHSAAARLAPAGVAVAHLMKYRRGDEPAAAGADEAELEGFLDRVQPGWRAHVRYRRFLPGMVTANAIPAAADGGLAGRPGPAVAARPGVFVAGDWVGGRGMIADAAVASGEEAATLALAALARTPARRTARAAG